MYNKQSHSERETKEEATLANNSNKHDVALFWLILNITYSKDSGVSVWESAEKYLRWWQS